MRGAYVRGAYVSELMSGGFALRVFSPGGLSQEASGLLRAMIDVTVCEITHTHTTKSRLNLETLRHQYGMLIKLYC